MKKLIATTFLFVLLAGCQADEKVSLDKIHWKVGAYADLDKKPISIILTNREPNLLITNTLYQQNFSEEGSQIVRLIQTGTQEKEDCSSLPFFYFPEQLWIAFEDNTGSVFSFFFDGYSSCIRAKEGIHYSDELADLMEWVRFCQVEHQPAHKVEYDKIKWKKGDLADLNKTEAVSIVIAYQDSDCKVKSNAELSFDFKESQLDDISKEAARISYLLGYDETAEEFHSDELLTQQMWIAFKDGTGSVFDCYENAHSDFYIRLGDIVRRAPQAQSVLEMIRRYPHLRRQVSKGKKPPCSKTDSVSEN